ncbi:MAG: DNA mismatch repair endonuclease MutL, partial [Gemmataceae bacterium]
ADEVIEIIRHMSMCHGKVPPGEEKLLTKAQITCQTGFCQSFLAFTSHATSKLHSVDDLFRIATLGFRGEALASIGSIAQVSLQSRPADQPRGAALTCKGGELSPVTAWNGAPGTRIEVRHLFYNTPARRKFLKAVSTEMGHVSEVFTRMTLAQPEVHLTLRHNGKLLHDVPGSVDLLDRIGLFFGAELCNSLYRVEAQTDSVALDGYIGDPSCDRGNSQTQYLILNGRWVRDRGFFQAVLDAYRGLLMTGRYPVAFLFVQMPPDQVDVNVHPTKAEVRFRNKDHLYQLVEQAVSQRLQEADLTARLQLKTGKENLAVSAADPRPPLPAEKSISVPPLREKDLPVAPLKASLSSARAALPVPKSSSLMRLGTASIERISPPPSLPAELFRPAERPPQATPGPSEREGRTQPDVVAESGVKALQVLDCYVVVEVPPDEVLFVDQHALHERILFEQLQERLRSGRLEAQRLLIPESVELPPSQGALVLEQSAALAELGLEVESFGAGTLMLRSYPALLGQRAPKEVLGAVIDYLLNKERVPSREQLLNDLLSLMACHAAVRVGDRLSAEAIGELLTQRELAQKSHHCPHGRPTSLRFTRHDLERQFKRV